MATISTLLDIGVFDGMATISTLLDIGSMVCYNIHFIRHWFDGMATISSLLDIGLMVWLQYPLY